MMQAHLSIICLNVNERKKNRRINSFKFSLHFPSLNPDNYLTQHEIQQVNKIIRDKLDLQNNLPMANQTVFNSLESQTMWDANAINRILFLERKQDNGFGKMESMNNLSGEFQNQEACPICRQDIQMQFMRMGQPQMNTFLKCIQNPFTKEDILFHSACLEHLHSQCYQHEATPPSKSKSLPLECATFSEAILTNTSKITKKIKLKRAQDIKYQRQLNEIFLGMVPRFQTGVQPPFRNFIHQMPNPQLYFNANEVSIEIKIFQKRITSDLLLHFENANLSFDLCGRTKFLLKPHFTLTSSENQPKLNQMFSHSQPKDQINKCSQVGGNWFHLQFNLPLETQSQPNKMKISIPKQQQNLIDRQFGKLIEEGSQVAAVLQSTPQYQNNQYRLNSQSDDTLIIEYTLNHPAFGTQTTTGAVSLTQLQSYQNTQYPWISLKVPSLASFLSKVMNSYIHSNSDTVFLHFVVQTRRISHNSYESEMLNQQEPSVIPLSEENSIFLSNLSVQIEFGGDLSRYSQLSETTMQIQPRQQYEYVSAPQQQCLPLNMRPCDGYHSGFSEASRFLSNENFYPKQTLSTITQQPQNPPYFQCQQQRPFYMQMNQPNFTMSLPQTTSVQKQQQQIKCVPFINTSSYSSSAKAAPRFQDQIPPSSLSGMMNIPFSQQPFQPIQKTADWSQQSNTRSLDQWDQKYCYKTNHGINQFVANALEVHTNGNFSSEKVLNNPQIAFQIQEIHNQDHEGGSLKTQKQISTSSSNQETPSKQQHLINQNNYSTRLTLLDSTKSSSIQCTNDEISASSRQKMIINNYDQQNQQFYEYENCVSHTQHHYPPSCQVETHSREVAQTPLINSSDKMKGEIEAVCHITTELNILSLEKGQSSQQSSHHEGKSHSSHSDRRSQESGKKSLNQGQNHYQELIVESDDSESALEISKNMNSSEEQPETIIPNLDDLISEVTTQKGSRNFQSIIKKASMKELSLVVERIQDHIAELMTDLYGNYFCQTLFRTISFEQRACLLEKLQPNFVKVSCHSVGTHAMQRLLDVICETHEKATVYDSIKGHIDTLAFDPKGNFVLIKIMLILNTPDTKTLEEQITKKLLPYISELINDQQGVCIVNKMIECTNENSHKLFIIEYLVKNLTAIMTNTYANYAVTTAFDTWGELDICEPLVFQLKERLQQFAIHQTSANVIEKCVERANMKLVLDCVEVLERDGVMKSMLKCPHTFFIIFKIYNRLQTNEQRHSLSEVLNMNIQFINDKTLREKCLALVSLNGEPVTPSQPSSGLLKANTSKLSKRQLRKQQKYLANADTTTATAAEQDETLFGLLQELDVTASHDCHFDEQSKKQRKNVKNGGGKAKKASSKEEYFTQASTLTHIKSKNMITYAEEEEQPQNYCNFDFQDYDQSYQDYEYSREKPSYIAPKNLKSAKMPHYKFEESYYGYSEDYDYSSFAEEQYSVPSTHHRTVVKCGQRRHHGQRRDYKMAAEQSQASQMINTNRKYRH